MNDESRPFRWLPPVSLVAIGVLVAATTFLAPGSLRITGQAVAIILALRLFCVWPPMVRWFGTMPIPHRCVLGFLLWGVVAGHFTISASAYYPFVAWEIFSFADERDPVTCQQFMATTASGKQTRLIMEQFFPSVVQMDSLEDPRHFKPETIERLARVLAKAYNARHPEDPVRRIDLVKLSVPLHPSPGDTPFKCELLNSYDF